MTKTSADYALPIKWMKYSLWLSLVLTGVKVTAWLMTHSSAILSDAVESLVNILAGSLGLYSIWLSSKPSDAEHPYGHGKVEFISSAVEGLMVLIAGIAIVWQGTLHLIHPQTIENLGMGMILILVSTLSHFAVGMFLIKKGKAYHSPTLEANGRHLRSDSVSSLALILGLGLIQFTGKVWIDNVVAILFGLYILYEGYGILRKSLSGIMDETDNAILDQLVDILNTNRKENWIDIHNFRAIRYGSVLHIDCHMTLPWYLNNRDAHEESEEVDRIINEKLERKVELFVHIDPCLKSSCRICQVQNCPERTNQSEEVLIWSRKSLITNARHR
jgi:cation diffusion facilitator family transporter